MPQRVSGELKMVSGGIQREAQIDFLRASEECLVVSEGFKKVVSGSSRKVSERFHWGFRREGSRALQVMSGGFHEGFRDYKETQENFGKVSESIRRVLGVLGKYKGSFKEIPVD